MPAFADSICVCVTQKCLYIGCEREAVRLHLRNWQPVQQSIANIDDCVRNAFISRFLSSMKESRPVSVRNLCRLKGVKSKFRVKFEKFRPKFDTMKKIVYHVVHSSKGTTPHLSSFTRAFPVELSTLDF